MQRWHEGTTIGVKDVLELFPRLGVPHFQRGRVWKKDSIAALLESLFYDTPCGSFVLWDSGDNGAHGIPLDESRPETLDYLVIDGQQRIRSLHEAFTDAPLNEDEGVEIQVSDEQSKKPKQWCINLAKTPGFDDLVKPRARNFPLFVHTANPREASARSPLRENVLPLAEIRSAATWDAVASYHDTVAFKSGLSKGEVARQSAERYLELRKKVLAIQDRQFFVARRDKTSSLAQMAELYNRINAGGKQVETEERAFATLVGFQPGNAAISDGLRTVFSAVHSDGRPRTGRDALLKREEERSLGFKLFIRVFLHVCQHHFGQQQRRSGFSFDVIDRSDFRQAYSALSSNEVRWLWDETRRLLKYVRMLLDEELHCDDLRSLPDATSLMPVLQLLIQYPDLEQAKYRPLLAALSLRIALANLNNRTVLEWIARAGDSTRVAFEVLPPLIAEATSRASKRLAQGLDDASSVQDRYVLLLYWLERHLGAHDFRYDRIPNPKCRLKPPELPLDKKASPEKQHLVPFSYASEMFGPDVRRNAANQFNNIGNLTYISAQENGLEALNNDFADLAGEREDDSQNLAAHLISSAEGDDALEHYEWLKKHFETTGAVETDPRLETERQERFGALTAARRRLIRSGFEQWLRDLDADALRRLNVSSFDELKPLAKTTLRIEPSLPRFQIEQDPVHVLRQLGLSAEVKDRVVVLLREAKLTFVGPSELHVQITKRRHVWVEVSKNGVRLGVRHLRGSLRTGVFQAVGLSDTHGRRHRLDPVPDFRQLIEYCAGHEQQFAQVVRIREADDSKRVLPTISELNYPPAVASLLERMGGSSKEKPRKGADLSLRFWQKKVTGGDEQVLRVDLYREERRIGLKCGAELGLRITERFPELVDISTHRTTCRLGTEEEMTAVLDWLVGQLPKS